MQCDVLVVGAGIAGLTLALKLATQRPEANIIVLTKTDDSESNTKYAQGGVAAVWDKNDSVESHIADTLDAGAGLCDEDIVRIVVTEGPERVREIIDWGARFDKHGDDFDLGREGGHSENRILHYKDLTGWEMLRALLEQVKQHPSIQLLEHHFAIEIITQHHLGQWINRVTPGIECYGVYALNKENNHIDAILAKTTVMAAGGIGQVYQNTTNPIIATGDGIAMMYRANGRVANMEFVQFHPTAFYDPTHGTPDFLVSEAVRGYGAILKGYDGEQFMQHYDKRESLAPRDIVARAIDNEMKVHGVEHMYLDCRHLDKEGFVKHFPTIYDHCRSRGIDPMDDMIPVVPACHYACGGISTDEDGRSSIKNLYACGEVTCTGLHGANRLASNSLLEAMVFAHRIFLAIDDEFDQLQTPPQVPAWDAEGTTKPNEMVLITQSRKEVKAIMSSYVGIVRSNVRLERALDRLHLMYVETEELYAETTISPQLCELRNMITVSYLITKGAAMRRESRGLHYTTDYLDKLDRVVNTWM